MSASALCLPGMCCEYSAASFFNSCPANHLAVLLCASIEVVKEALYSQPSALELSVRARILCGLLESRMVKTIVMAAAMNSRRLMER